MKNIFIYLTIFLYYGNIFSKISHKKTSRKQILPLTAAKLAVTVKILLASCETKGIKMEKKNQNPNITLLEDIYKSVSFSADTLEAIIGKTEDDGQKALLSEMLDTYEGFARGAKHRLRDLGEGIHAPGALEKLPSEISVAISTLTDHSGPNIARLVIEEAVTNVSEFKERIRVADEAGADLRHIRLAGDILAFHEEMINKMRRYL